MKVECCLYLLPVLHCRSQLFLWPLRPERSEKMAGKTYLKTTFAISLLMVVLAFAGTAHAKIIIVDDDLPADFNNIQAAIESAGHGDVIIVNPGTYTGEGNRDIDFLGKAITVRSMNGPETCIINCEGTESESHRGFYFHSGEGPDSVLSGLTITNGYAPKRQIGKYIRMLGGAIYCDYSSPVITNCIFRENISGWKGGAIMSAGSKPKIINCLFQNNVAQWGGGLHTSAVYGSSQGPIMTNCTFVDNFANNHIGGGGVYCDSTGKTTLTNCILWGNTSQGGGVYEAQVHLPNPVISYCCIEGSFGSDPLLAPDGYHLLAGSPCIDAGDPSYIAEPDEKDLDGKPRVIGGRIDMGAYEYQPRILYVDDDTTGKNDGSSWADAYNYLQDALSAAWRGDEIRVAQGIYTPNSNSTEPDGSGDREATFQLINGVKIQGGCAGAGTPDPNARDIELYETTLSGDLNGDDNGSDNISENSYRVVTGSSTDATAVLDGFTVTASCGERPDKCGGLFNLSGSPTVTNCTFIDNWALYGHSGNGMFNRYSSPTMTNCTFDGSDRNNALLNEISSLTVTNCIFIKNDWCGIISFGGSLQITNCLFSDNRWAIFIDYCDPIIKNCTFSGNNKVIEYDGGASAALTNCIVWKNADADSFYAETVNYSCLQGTWDEGQGNITENPLFLDPDNGDYHPLEDSPCIDTGDPNYVTGPNETDLDGNPRVMGGRIDMGAYEAPIPAKARCVSRTINLASQGKWITCYIWLPEEYNVADIDPNTVLLDGQVKAESVLPDERQQVATVKFILEDVKEILTIGEVELTITGQLIDGTTFEAADTIKVIDKGPGKNK